MSNKGYYKTKMREYEKARNKLETYKEELDRYLDNCLTHFNKFTTVYEPMYNLQGEVMDNFNYKSEDFSKEVNRLFSKIRDDISIINNKKVKANELYIKYKRLYEDACRHHHDKHNG
ncbi:hypothetical protein [Clostridium uliginosum]|uniref:Uncharacterized protein n=1 Tax=Clostridium uliginosum TaxID=119641 RepID=A0A1I1RC89_9CLOT|nr:hypothetical protein [Clostridium uliginosum]SFD28000.1 hypothetical protein SAMN05421842_12923 [Clostridium uliginosum]